MQATILRLWLRSIWATVPGTFTTLSLALNDLITSRLEAISGGTVLLTSANGHSVQLASPDKGLSAEDWAEGLSYLMDLYDNSLAALIQGGIPAPSDAQIYVEMLDQLRPITTMQNDFTALRLNASL